MTGVTIRGNVKFLVAAFPELVSFDELGGDPTFEDSFEVALFNVSSLGWDPLRLRVSDEGLTAAGAVTDDVGANKSPLRLTAVAFEVLKMSSFKVFSVKLCEANICPFFVTGISKP